MDKSVLKRLILEHQTAIKNISIVERDVQFEPHSNYVLVGLRRAGKSYLLYQYVKNLLASGHSIEEVLYFNFEDDRLGDVTVIELDEIIVAYNELFDRKPIVLLDEIQIVDGWEKFARRLADQKYRVIITGSNAKMLSSEISTTLGGRYIVQTVLPFSFTEYLSAKGVEVDEHWQYLPCPEVKRAFDEYLHFGGLPELTAIDKPFQRSWLSNLSNKIYMGDMVARYNIRNTMALKVLLRKLAESVMQPMSFNRLAHMASSVAGKVKQDTVVEYISHAEDTCLIFAVENIAAKLQERMGFRKHYFADNGLLNLYLFDGETLLHENLVAITLHRLYPHDLYYYLGNVEVDFCLYERRIAVQVSYNISDESTLARETKALLAYNKLMPQERLVIITLDDEKTLEVDGHRIDVIPVWKWLLLGGEL